MSTEVTKSQAALPAAISALVNIGQNAVATTGAIGGGDAFGKFTKDGLWIYGQEEIEVQEGSTWAVNPLSLRHGHVGWPRGEATGRPTEVTAPLTDPLPQQPDDTTLDWGHCMSFQAICLTGDDEGQQVLFKGGSIGFLKATTGLAQQIAGRAQEGEADLVPHIEFGGSSYKHKSYGKINTPVLTVIGWAGMDSTEAKAEPEEEEKPEPEAKAEAKKPARRRRVMKK